MFAFETSVAIDQRIERVWEYLADLANVPEWNWAIESTVKTTDGPRCVGTRYEQTRTVPTRMTEWLELTALDPPSRVEIDGMLAGLPAHVEYVLGEKDGRTIVVAAVELARRGPRRLLAPLIGPRIESAVAANMGELRARLEAEPRD